MKKQYVRRPTLIQNTGTMEVVPDIDVSYSIIRNAKACMEKVLSIHDLAPMFMFYDKIYIRSLYKYSQLDIDPLSTAIKSLYCIHNSNILTYVERVEVHIMYKALSMWDGTDPVPVYIFVDCARDNIDKFLNVYPNMHILEYNDDIVSLLLRFELLVANSIGINAVKQHIVSDFVIRYQNCTNPLAFIVNFFDGFEYMYVKTDEIVKEYCDFIDVGEVGMTIFNEMAYTMANSFNDAVSSFDYYHKLNACKIIKIDTSMIEHIKSNPKQSSSFFARIIHVISKCANKIEHFEVNYTNDTAHMLHLSETTRNDMMDIISRCKVVIIRGKFDFDTQRWGINVTKCQHLERCEIDNINPAKHIFFITSLTSAHKMSHISLYNNVVPFGFNVDVKKVIIDITNMPFTSYACSTLSSGLEHLEISAKIKNDIDLKLCGFPKLKKLHLNITCDKDCYLRVSTSSPQLALHDLKINKHVKLINLDVPNLHRFTWNEDDINDDVFAMIPSSTNVVITKQMKQLDALQNMKKLRLLDKMYTKMIVRHKGIKVVKNIFIVNT